MNGSGRLRVLDSDESGTDRGLLPLPSSSERGRSSLHARVLRKAWGKRNGRGSAEPRLGRFASDHTAASRKVCR
jgi:hypothetical protein